ncbi:uncharacterized protein BHQ10_001073 [Talaromyces amestolkiae]|uniref:Uncharacterized protein n=1 Tax=Talaromyces amestolkiae TaxID=1196081 RepID=A0A364KNH3_TALAM|nr:uncharacterized protein BHQ10_001073 [Talaromyces amestolkiae]RAO65061.1 hypothetical protein BHQ10_001073 [Talaromyces amestolkiae]
MEQSLLKYQSTGGLRKIATSAGDFESTAMRLSRSESALHRMALHRSASDELVSNRKPALSKLETGRSEHLNDRESQQLDVVSAVLSAGEDATSSNFPTAAVSPLSLEMPMMGPTFGVEIFRLEAQTETDIGNISETSASTSSSPEMWEEKPRYPSSASSNSTLRSDFDTETSSSDMKPLQRPSTPPRSERRPLNSSGKKNSPEDKAKSVKFSKGKKRGEEQYFKQKPLPDIPPTLSIVNPQSAQHIARLTSKYSSSRSESPIDRLIVLQATEKTLTQAANDLERELEKIGDVHPALRPEQPLSKPADDDENLVAPLNISPKPNRTAASSMNTQKENVPQGKQPRTYRVFPPSEKPDTTAKDNTIQHNRYNSNSSTESETIGVSVKQNARDSPSSKGVSRKVKSSVRLPTLRRSRNSNQTAQAKPDGGNKKSDISTRSPVKSLQDEQAALARSTDRYIDAEIAKALNMDHEDDEDDDGENNKKDAEESEWSTMYPLKAVKKLGIPLLTNSHIPRLSSYDAERILRQQLPKLDTNSIVSAIDCQKLPPSSIALNKRYPETPDDIGIQARSFITDSTPIQTPTEEKFNTGNVESHNDKVFVGFDRMETVPEGMSPKTEEVPLIMGTPTMSNSPATVFPPRKKSLYELDEYGSTPISQTTKSFFHIKLPMPTHMTDEVVLALMKNVDNLDALFKYAQVNRQFYRVFKNNELPLIKNALFNMNPPAWELREMSPPWSDNSDGLKDPDAPVPEYTASSYLHHYARDVFALVRLKALIYARCSSIVRSETIGGLTGENDVRAAEIDEAFWRIWTFCRIFGCGKNREGDLNGQIDWLNAGYLAKKNKSGATVITAEPFFSMNNVLFDPPSGFGDGNRDGLTCNQLYDMLEIWNCLGTLVQGFNRECKDARVAGIFDGLDIPVGDIAKEEAMLEEWTHYILTLGPSALVGLSSLSPDHSTEEIFTKAKQMGMTKWEAPEDGGTRSSFLREAIARAYDSRVSIQQKLSNSPVSNGGSVDSAATRRERIRNLTINSTRNTGQPENSSWNDGDDASTHRVPPYTCVNNDGTSMAPLLSPPPRYSVTEARLIDPVDKAIHRMVHELGFSERDATWALKITDTGDMLDINAAVQLLVREREKRNRFKASDSLAESTASGRDDCLVDISRHRGTVSWRWA